VLRFISLSTCGSATGGFPVRLLVPQWGLSLFWTCPSLIPRPCAGSSGDQPHFHWLTVIDRAEGCRTVATYHTISSFPTFLRNQSRLALAPPAVSPRPCDDEEAPDASATRWLLQPLIMRLPSTEPSYFAYLPRSRLGMILSTTRPRTVLPQGARIFASLGDLPATQFLGFLRLSPAARWHGDCQPQDDGDREVVPHSDPTVLGGH
jgi:hypothetical protein